jgi:transmembrane sensor
MKHIDKELLDRFFNDECSAEEAEKVLKWFGTPEGKKFLQESLDTDVVRFMSESKRMQSNYPEPDSDELLASIDQEIRKQDFSNKRKRQYIYPIIKAAASVLVILTAAYFYQFAYEPQESEIAEVVPIHYATSEDEQREITLGDGSTIRLNSNSEILISSGYMSEGREIELQGEAYFDVVHNPDRPFIIHANESVIEVLGTSFNVKSYEAMQSIQVAVTEGRVAFKRGSEPADEQNSVLLEKGQYGYLDLNNNKFSVDDFAIKNYLAWMSGRLVFEDLSLGRVCLQLNRLYEVNCTFENESLTDLKLTANFSDESLDKTLSVVALTLDIGFRINDSEVVWIEESITKESENEMVN